MDQKTAQDYVKEYYNEYDEESRFDRRFNAVEYITTMRYIEKYLRPGMRVAEIGAGTGRYSLALADRGYTVDAVELVQHNIDVFKSKMKPHQNATILQGDAVSLPLASETYDITLLLGPMYHLFSREDALRALGEALRVTKRGGKVFAAYVMNDLTVYDYLFVRGKIQEYKQKQYIDSDFHANPAPELIFQLYRTEDIDSLMAGFNVKRLHFVATDMISCLLEECIDNMDEDTFSDYMDFHFKICERRDMLGMTSHSLDIFEKE